MQLLLPSDETALEALLRELAHEPQEAAAPITIPPAPASLAWMADQIEQLAQQTRQAVPTREPPPPHMSRARIPFGTVVQPKQRREVLASETQQAFEQLSLFG